MRETGRSAGSLDHVTIRRRVSEPMRPISVRRVVTDGSSERGTTTGRCITDGSRTAPYYRGSHRRGDEVMEKRGRQDGITTEQAKGRTQRWQPLLPNLQRVNEAARNSGQTRFTALLHHVDVAALERAFRRQRRAASPGMDRVTVDDYARELEANLRRLHDSVDSGQYWPKPVRRTYIPKADGGRRPLGIPALEDKIVQGAVAEVLNAVYEADFMGFSYGFRPERSPHAALAALDKALMTQRVDWVLDVDIRTFFDSVDHGWLMRMLTHRIADRRVLRLLEWWLKAGLLESGRWEPVEVGTPQGSGISPILANVFLHYAVDLWVHRWRRRSAAGQVIICRYADDRAPRRREEGIMSRSTPGSLAAQEMRVGPSGSDCRIRVQTTASCVGPMAEVVSVAAKGGSNPVRCALVRRT